MTLQPIMIGPGVCMARCKPHELTNVYAEDTEAGTVRIVAVLRNREEVWLDVPPAMARTFYGWLGRAIRDAERRR